MYPISPRTFGKTTDGTLSRASAGVVHLVGAGPGDPEMLTLKAWRLIRQVDVIVHDRLVSAEILALARPDARHIDVGKAPGRHRYGQGEINALLVELARTGKRVLRLKGGDPFIFGRGGEELDYLRRQGVRAEVVPGITAATGAAASARIPLTQRGVATAVTLVTGHDAGGLPDLDFAALAGTGRTLAIYMGVGHAAEIAARLIAGGLDRATPVAVVENATAPDERRFTGPLADLADLLRRHRVKAPALLLVGEVVALADASDIPAALAV